jgi:hypothetical protein
MSGIGSSSCVLVLDRDRGFLRATGYNKFRQTVNLTLTGHTPSAAANLVLMLFRPDATLCASAAAFSGSTASAVSAVETNTTPILNIMAPTGKTPVGNGAIRSFIMRLYDGSTTEKIGEGWMSLRGTGEEATLGSPAAPPAEPGANFKAGNMAMQDGYWYGRNDDDGLWYPIGFSGASGAIQIDLGGTGIVIP